MKMSEANLLPVSVKSVLHPSSRVAELFTRSSVVLSPTTFVPIRTAAWRSFYAVIRVYA
jgi:hypothetical protein